MRDYDGKAVKPQPLFLGLKQPDGSRPVLKPVPLLCDGEVRHVGEQDRLAEGELRTDAYTLVNLRGAVRPFADKDVTVFAEAHNLTDEEAREHTSFLKDIAPLPGRNLRIGVSYAF